MKKAAQYLLIIIPFLWAGILLGISFLEAPLKFQAPGVTLQIGAGIGNLVFHALNKVEIAFLFILLCCYYFANEKNISFFILMLSTLILALQTFWLLPALDVRVEMLRQGMALPDSSLHFYYIAAEAIKLILVFGLGGLMIRSILKRPSETVTLIAENNLSR